VEEKAHKAQECLIERRCREASEERQELTEVEHLEKQAAEEKAAKEREERICVEKARKAAEEKEVNEKAEMVWKAAEAKKAEGSKKGKGPTEAGRTPAKVSAPSSPV
jgi:hypothetical protein